MGRLLPWAATGCALVLFASPAVLADEQFLEEGIDGLDGDECFRLIGAWTEATQPKVDIYVSRLVDFDATADDSFEPVDLWKEVDKNILKAWNEVDRQVRALLEDEPPGKIGDKDIVVQIELTFPRHASLDLDGIRLTYELSVLSCIGD